MPARASAVSRSGVYPPGARSRTAMRSNGMPLRASSSTRRAISTDSRPSPGAEKSTTFPVRPSLGGASGEKMKVRRRSSSSLAGAGAGVSAVGRWGVAASVPEPGASTWKARRVSSSPGGRVARTDGARASNDASGPILSIRGRVEAASITSQ